MLMSQSASSSPTPRSTSRVMTKGLIGPELLHRGNLALVELTKLKVGGRVGPWSRMSALGHKRTCAVQKPMSALHPIATAKADIGKPSGLLYPRKRTCAVQLGMSAMGQ